VILNAIINEIQLSDLPDGARKVAGVLGIKQALLLSDKLGGEYLRLPKNAALTARRRWIERHLDDMTDEAIAKRLKLAPAQVYEIRIQHQRNRTTFGDVFGEKESRTVATVALAVANHFGRSLTDLRGPERTADVAWPRHVAMYLVRQVLPHLSLQSIGDCFGGRDHSTVSAAVMVVRDRMHIDSEARTAIERLLTSILENLPHDTTT
jgi:chromosomal replication initiation ATPase DnaA